MVNINKYILICYSYAEEALPKTSNLYLHIFLLNICIHVRIIYIRKNKFDPIYNLHPLSINIADVVTVYLNQ